MFFNIRTVIVCKWMLVRNIQYIPQKNNKGKHNAIEGKRSEKKQTSISMINIILILKFSEMLSLLQVYSHIN